MGGDGLGEEVEGVLVALAAGFQDSQQGLDEAAAVIALGAEAELFPVRYNASLRDHGMTQRAFGGVVGRVEAGGGFREAPEVVIAFEQARAGGCSGVVGAAGSVLQGQVNLAIESIAMFNKCLPSHGAVANAVPVIKHVMGKFGEAFSNLSRLPLPQGHRFEIPLQVSPAPLQPGAPQIHLGSIAR